jgi:methoxymalonate biosynthesis protein
MTNTVTTVGIVGAGVMGCGIATLLSLRGVDSVVYDVDPAVLAQVTANVRRNRVEAKLNRAVASDQQISTRGRISTVTAIEDMADVDLVVEAVFERTAVKQAVLAEISPHVRGDVPILTNTSCIPLADLAAAVHRPQRFAGAHFMNPPYLMPGAELICGTVTGEHVVDALATLFAEQWALRPFVVHDRPGFVVNAVLQLMIAEAIRLVADGEDPATVDAALVASLGHRTGPLATADRIGLDTTLDTLIELTARRGPAYAPDELLRRMVLEEGRLGRKSGHGFFGYPSAGQVSTGKAAEMPAR